MSLTLFMWLFSLYGLSFCFLQLIPTHPLQLCLDIPSLRSFLKFPLLPSEWIIEDPYFCYHNTFCTLLSTLTGCIAVSSHSLDSGTLENRDFGLRKGETSMCYIHFAQLGTIIWHNPEEYLLKYHHIVAQGQISRAQVSKTVHITS